ncbi:MAG: hypothetical protein ACI87W_003277 [Halieaceae bacterium]|jgi:hypothetical protein
MTLLSARYTKYLKLALALIAAIAVAAHSNEPPDSNSSIYIDSENPMRDVQIALDKARSTDKLLLVVMGAQWCHDSRGLAEKFEDPDVAAVLLDNYETVIVNVGYFKDLRSISQRFDQAHYFSTPTVMIIDASTERLINGQDMHIWGSAGRLPTSKYVDYFTTYANTPSPVFVPLPEAHAAAIADFEQANAQRLGSAYELLVPGMKLEDNTGEASDGFIEQWREVQRYRTRLQEEIRSIRQQAVAAPDKPLSFPSYAAFSWEGQY